MMIPIYRRRFSASIRALVVFVLTAFLTTSIPPVPGFAQIMRHTPSPAFMRQLTTIFTPLSLKGVQLVPENPLRFDFLVDKGNSGLSGQALQEESIRLVKYFLTALTIPEKDMWVNLSPYEKETIITDSFIRTQMGKVLLEQDYVLKQMTASLTYPETPLGKQFWGRVYQKAFELFGTTDIPIDTFNKVWVVPKTADVVVYKQGALVVDGELDVMVESDYLALANNRDHSGPGMGAGENAAEQNQLYSNIIREVIIPELRKEVNEGKEFAPLRQVYNALILATWYKRNLKNGVLSKIYVRQNKVDGVNVDDPSAKEKVYAQYIETFRKGVYNYIREDFDEATKQIIPRKYISGGMAFGLLGLGGPEDKYRELAPPQSMKFIDGPFMVSTDLTLLTPNGDHVGLPSPVSFAGTTPEETTLVGSSKAKQIPAWLRKIVWTVITSTALFFSSHAIGAQFIEDTKGNLIVEIEQGDTYGQVIENMRAAYRSTDFSAYKRSKLSGSLWGHQGVVERMSDGKNVNQLTPKDQFKFEKGLLPEEAIKKLITRINPELISVSVPADSVATEFEAVKDDKVYGTNDGERLFVSEPGLGTDFLGLFAGFAFIWGVGMFLSTGKRKNPKAQTIAPKSQKSGVGAKNLRVLKGGIKIITSEDELPRLDDELEKDEHPSGIFVGADEPVASAEENALWQREQIAVAGNRRSALKSSRALWPMDILGSALGVILTGITSDWNPQAVGIAALVMPFATRLAYGVQVFLHESLGHFVPSLLLSPERGKVFTVSNFFANFGWNEWARMTLAGFKAPSKDKVPGVDTWSSGWRKKVIDVSGFVVSLGVGLLAGIESMNIWMPLIGPIGVASLSVLAGSYSTDIKGAGLSQTVDDQCSGSKCGIFGALWFDKSDDMYPPWIREGFTRSINALIIRGGQSAGEFTIGLKSSGNLSTDGSSDQMVPVLSKVLKYKRGSGLTETLDKEFARLVDAMQKKKIKAVHGVKGILVHVRFATGGKVTREASHPHMGTQEERDVWQLVSGQWIRKAINIFVAIGHNGDNDIWKIWGLRLNTGQMRELFPALFRMKKTFKVTIKTKDPRTGKEVKETRYDALPPGDSPPLALQMHYLLTQGDWLSSARFAYVDQVINYDVRETLAGASLSDKEMASLTEIKLKRAIDVLPTEEEEKIIGEAFQNVFLKHQDALLRPRLKRSDKSFADLWVTPEIVSAHPSLQYQLDALNSFRDDLSKTMMSHLRDNTPAGLILRKAGNMNEDLIRHFVQVAVEKFFTGNRAAAVREFAQRSEGSYGMAVRTSKEPDGVTLYSSDQGVTIGYNKKERLVTFSSEHSTLQYAFGEKGKMDDLVFINPEQPGQMADVNLSNDPQSTNPITIKVYSFALKRTMTPEEIAEQQFPQDSTNPYWSPQVSYKDPNNIVMTDVHSISKEVRAARQSWANPDSFNRQSAEPLLEKMASRHLENYIKANSQFYGTAQGTLASRLFSASTECLAGGGCDSNEANRRSAQLSNRLQADGRVLSYLKSRLDWVVGQLADQFAREVISGVLNETDLVVLFHKKVDEQLKFLLDREVKEIVDAVIVGNLNALQSWKDWEQDEKISKESEAQEMAQENQSGDSSGGVISQGLKFMANIVARFMSSKSPVPEDLHPMEGQSLGSGQTDMIVAGYEDSLWFGENFVSMMKVIFPRMNIWATSTNKAFNLNGQHNVGRRTVSMIISKSGATFPSRGIVRRLKQLSPGNIFAMTSRVDTLIAIALGQKFQPDSPFIKRIFVTGNYYPAEANSVGEIMLFAHQIELVIYLAVGMRAFFPEQKPWGMNLNSADILKLKDLRDKMYDEARRLTGYDEKGKPIDGSYVRQMMVWKLKNGYLRSTIQKYLAEARLTSRRLNANDIKRMIGWVVRYDGPDADPDIQSALTELWDASEQKGTYEVIFRQVGGIDKIDESKISSILINLLETRQTKNDKKMEDAYLRRFHSISDNAGALGKTMAETGIVTNIVFRIFVMGIFWFGAPLENVLSLWGIHFGPTLHDFGGMAVRTVDGILTLFAPLLMTALIYRTWSGRPHWSRLGPPTVALGDPIPALHQTGESFWSKLGAVALGSMTMNVHGANPDDHFVARLAHRVVRGTIAIFGVPVDPSTKDNVIVTMKQTKAIRNGMFLNFFKGGAEVFSIGRGELNNPDITDHHMDIGEQNLEGASKTVKEFNNYAFDAFGRDIAYKVLFAQAYDWATRWEPKISLLGRSISLKKFSIWNSAWTYSRTGVHTTRTPKGGPTEELPVYLDPAQGGGSNEDDAPASNLSDGKNGGSVQLANGSGSDRRDFSVGAVRSRSNPTANDENVLTSSTGDIVGIPDPRRGGIDLNMKWLDLRVTADGEAKLFLDDQNIELIPIRGIMPTILNIRPMSMDQVFLLMENSNKPDPEKLMSRIHFDFNRSKFNRFKGGSYHASIC